LSFEKALDSLVHGSHKCAASKGKEDKMVAREIRD